MCAGVVQSTARYIILSSQQRYGLFLLYFPYFTDEDTED